MDKNTKLWIYVAVDTLIAVAFFFFLFFYEGNTYTWMVPEGFDQPQQLWQKWDTTIAKKVYSFQLEDKKIVGYVADLPVEYDHHIHFPQGLEVDDGDWIWIVGEFKNILGATFYLPYADDRTAEVYNEYLRSVRDEGYSGEWTVPIFPKTTQFKADATVCQWLSDADGACTFVGDLQRLLIVVVGRDETSLKPLEIRE